MFVLTSPDGRQVGYLCPIPYSLPIPSPAHVQVNLQFDLDNITPISVAVILYHIITDNQVHDKHP